jgi:hypothetical protein
MIDESYLEMIFLSSATGVRGPNQFLDGLE